MTKNRVLVPNDGSTFCRQIYPHIAKFLTPEQTTLILLRVGPEQSGLTPTPPKATGYGASVPMYDSHRDAELALHPIYASQERDSAAAAIRSEMTNDIHLLEQAGYLVEVEARFGERGEEIVKFAEHNNIDLIAMTTHWRRGIQKIIFGSVAQYVAAHVNVPILMVHPVLDEG